MTNTASTVNTAIDALVAKGSTAIPAGLLWDWRVISPTAPFTEGASYTDDKWVKAIVLLTDGQNDVGGGSNGFDKSYYNAFGFAKNGHLGSTSGSHAEATLALQLAHERSAGRDHPGHCARAERVAHRAIGQGREA